MTTAMLGQWSLIAATLLLSIYALSVARRTSDRSLLKQLREHSTRLQEIEENLDTVTLQLKRERARNNMRSLRESRRVTEADEQEQSGAPSFNGSDAEAAKDRWQRETNLRIASGELKPFWRR